VQIARVSLRDLLEFQSAVGDEARENVQPACGALWVGFPADVARKYEALEQRNDVNGVRLEQGRPGQVILGNLQIGDFVAKGRGSARKETGLNAISDVPETQIHRGGLNLVIGNSGGAANLPIRDQFADLLRRQNPGSAFRTPRLWEKAQAESFP